MYSNVTERNITERNAMQCMFACIHAIDQHIYIYIYIYIYVYMHDSDDYDKGV